MHKGKPALCPFCGREVAPPRNLGFQYADFDAGFCDCGAVYVSDVTGHNLGAAFVEALTLACGGDWDLAWDLVPEEDYQERLLEHYDQRAHQVFAEGSDRPVRGVLYFLRLDDEIRGLSQERIEALRAKRRKRREGPPPGFRPRRLRREEAEGFLRQGREKEVVLLCRYQPVNLRTLQKLLYSADPAIRWRTVVTLGEAARELLEEKPDLVADLVKRLIYASADSAASAWGALETVGEVIRHAPERFGLFVRNLFAFLKYPEFRPAALWALGRIGERHPRLVRREPVLKLLDLADDPSPQTRGVWAWAVGQMGLFEARGRLEALLGDEAEAVLYRPETGALERTTVAALAREALARLGEDR